MKQNVNELKYFKDRIESYKIALNSNSSPFFQQCMVHCIQRDELELAKLENKIKNNYLCIF